MKRDKRVLEIIKDKIREEYKDDISLLVVYGTEQLKEANQGMSFYFIPKNEMGKSLSTQFVIEDISYDLFPISWDRLVANAAMDSPQGYLLLDTEVVYCSDDEALQRFEGLKNSLRTVLGGKYRGALLNKAYEYFNECYIYLYNMNQYKDSMGSVRIESSKLLKKIANALAFANCDYYKNSNGFVIKDSFELEYLPKDYKELADEIIFGDSYEAIYEKALKLVKNTREFLMEIKRELREEESFEIFFTGYYEELKKSINKCKNALEQNDYYRLFELLTFIQEETAQFITKVQEGIWYDDRNAYIEFNRYFEEIFKVDLVEKVSSRDNGIILDAIENFEEGFINFMLKNNVKLAVFDSVQEFQNYFKNK